VRNAVFRDITKQISTVSIDQHGIIMPLSCAMLPFGLRPSGNITQLRGNFSVNLGTSQYLFTVDRCTGAAINITGQHYHHH